LAGYVSEHAAYHHGEASLNQTITNMAQIFVGANNINLLKPMGQFGSRLMGGKDAASPRYIHTYLENIVRTIYRKEDAGLLTHIEDDGESVEPEYYLPVVPMITLNGVIGIGTGYSTDIPPYKPDDIICLLQHRLQGSIESLAERPLDPWWFGFKGQTVRADENTWLTKGIYVMDDEKKTVTITELPVGCWTKDYKAFLDALCEADEKKSKEAKKEAKKAETGSNKSAKDDVEPCGLKGFDDLYNDQDVCFILYFTEEGYDAIKDHREKFEKQFKLTTSWKTTNMTCFDTDFNIVKYKTVGDILEAFVEKRLPMYEARRTMLLEALEKQVVELDAKRRFIQAILDERLMLQKRSDEEIIVGLKENDIPPLSNPDAPDAYDSYDYVLRMRMDRVKAVAVAELDGQIAEKRGEMEHLESETASSLWQADLEEFREEWTAYTQERVASNTAVAQSGTKGKKRPAVGKK
jgi:DNA topoisomerase-2